MTNHLIVLNLLVGATLVMLATSNTLGEGFYDQMAYLIEQHEADCTLVDSEGNNAVCATIFHS